MNAQQTQTTILARCVLALCAIFLELLLCSSTLFAQATDKPPAVNRGFTPTGSYALSDIETISPVSGNMMFHFPLASLPAGRNGLKGAANFVYNSKLYELSPQVGTDINNNTITWDELTTSPQGGWRWATGYQIYIKRPPAHTINQNCPQFVFQNKLYMSFPDGSEHEFRPLGWTSTSNGQFVNAAPNTDGYYDIYPDGLTVAGCPGGGQYITNQPITYYSVDGTYLRLVFQHDADTSINYNNWKNNPWTLYLPDGGKITDNEQFTANPPSPPVLGQRIYDQNNNFVEIRNTLETINNVPNTKVTRVVDQFNRKIEIIHVNPANPYGPTTLSYQGFGSTGTDKTVTWTINWTTISPGYYLRVFSNGNQDQYPFPDLYSVSQISPPSQTGLSPYIFSYTTQFLGTGCGEVGQITLPSGARALYSYGLAGSGAVTAYTIVNSDNIAQKQLIYNREYDGTTTPVTETWNYSTGPAGSSGWTCTMSSPDGGNITQWAYHNPSDPLAWNDKLVFKTQNADGSVDEKYWLPNIPQGIYPLLNQMNPYAKTEYHSIRDAANNLTKTAIKDYNYDKNGNIYQVVEYDWVDYSAAHSAGNPITNLTSITGLTVKRVTTNTWYNPTPDAANTTQVSPNAYHMAYTATMPTLLRIIQTNEICPSVNPATAVARTEYFYDGASSLSTAPTAGNLTEQRSWDTTKAATISRPLSSSPIAYVASKNQYSNWGTGNTGRLDVSIDANGNYTRYTYGAINTISGAVTNLYPTQVVTGDNAGGTSTIKRTATNEYDLYSGVVTRAVDVDNNVTNMSTYDIFGRPTLVKEAYGTASERHTVTEYSDTGRRVIVRSDLNTMDDQKVVKISHYDPIGRIRLSRELEDPMTQNATVEADGIKVQTRYAYTGSNMCEVVSAPYRASTCSAATNEPGMGWKRSKYDSGGRMIELETFSGGMPPSPWGNNTTSTGKVTTAYDAECVTITDQALKVRRSLVDACGRLVRVDEPSRDFTPAEISAALPNRPNPNLILGNASSPNQPTYYSYNALNNPTATSQTGIPNGGTTAVTQSRTFNYSSLGRLISASNPESGMVQYAYEDNGNLLTKTDARGITLTYTYDRLNRNLTVNYSNTAVNPDITRMYDGATYGKGKLWKDYAGGDETNGQSVESKIVNSYDALGRPLSVSQRFKNSGAWSGNFTTAQTYNLAGGVGTKTYPSGHTTTNTYDNEGRLTQFAGNLGNGTARTYATGITYNAQGQMLREQFGTTTALYHNRHYNRRGQAYDARLGTGSTDEWSWNRGAIRMYFSNDYSDYNATPSYSYDNGNLYRQDHFVPNDDAVTSWSMAVDYYSYDWLNRATGITEQSYYSSGTINNTFNQNFSYDRFGNRLISSMAGTGIPNPGFKLNCTPTTGTCTNTNNRLIAPTDTDGVTATDKMQYDTAGNLVKDTHTQPGTTGLRTYDAENRMLTAIGLNNQMQGYVYDADGRRTRRVLNNSGETWWQVYGVSGDLVAEYQMVGGTPTLKKEYGQRNGQLLIVADATSSTCQWLVADTLGTPRIIADQTGGLSGIKRHDYLPFGEEVFANIGNRVTTNGYALSSPTSQPPRQQFVGYERDNETGLDFVQARYYGSIQGRFTSVDPFDPILGKQGAEDAEAAERELRNYLRQPQHWNRYVYALNNPLKYVDPDGMDPITVNLNIIYDQNSNYTDEERKRIRERYIAQAQKNFGKIDIKFNVTETTGAASNLGNPGKQAIISGTKDGAINAFFTKGSVGPSSESTKYASGSIFISTSVTQGADSRDLTHGIIHATGIAGGINGYRGPTKFLNSYILGGLLDYGPGSAEYHTEAIQQYLEGRREPIYTYGYNSAKTGASPTVTNTTTHTAKDMQVLKNGLQRYSGK